MSKINVTIWNEFRHEKENEGIKAIYPEGLHAAIAKGIAENHNGHLEFSRSKDGGLAVALVMTTVTKEENSRGEKPCT